MGGLYEEVIKDKEDEVLKVLNDPRYLQPTNKDASIEVPTVLTSEDIGVE